MFKFGLVKTYYFEYSFSKDSNLKDAITSYMKCESNTHLAKSSLGRIMTSIKSKQKGEISFRLGTKSHPVTRAIREDFIKHYNLSPTEIFSRNHWF